MIEARLRGATRQVKGITIWRTHDGRGWQTAMTIDGTGWVCETDGDLVAALGRLLSRYGREPEAIACRDQLTLAIRRLMCG